MVGETTDRNVLLAFILLFLGAKPALREAKVFSSVLIPSPFHTQAGRWNWAVFRLRLPQGNLRASRRFIRHELLAGLPAGAWCWPLARAAMPTLPGARLPLPTLRAPA